MKLHTIIIPKWNDSHNPVYVCAFNIVFQTTNSTDMLTVILGRYPHQNYMFANWQLSHCVPTAVTTTTQESFYLFYFTFLLLLTFFLLSEQILY